MGDEGADGHATEVTRFLTLEANPERLSKCRNVWPILNLIVGRLNPFTQPNCFIRNLDAPKVLQIV